ncbi:Response regulator [Sulfidibacter corallicola]|uniref:histidine kinase n=1 Tax=Sulfidibacter corallicola TaxID=2818388 RepID=A0A8A4TK40_SULCO|nr:two-component regulator propeller domain-containing protein [Sulfidibacter corallicola]QTD49847.1 response regulator [Sulfidibacter corallicola]
MKFPVAKATLFFLCLVLAPPNWGPGLMAQQKTLHFARYDDQAGLSQNSALSLHQDRKGYIWIGTQDGLNRFDGYTFRTFKNVPGDPHSLSDDWVWVIDEDRNGTMWVGTHSGGLNRFHRDTERFDRYPADRANPDMLADAEVRAFYQDPQGTIWVGTRHGGLHRLRADGRGFDRLNRTVPGGPDMSRAFVTEILEDRSGLLWVGSHKGLFTFDSSREILVPYLGPSELDQIQVTAIFEGDDGTLWIGTTQHGLVRLNPVTGEARGYRLDDQISNAGSVNHITGLVPARDGTIWLATRVGLQRLTPGTESLEAFRHDPGVPESLSSNLVLSAMEDSTGVLWFGTLDRGVNKFNPKTEVFAHYQSTSDTERSLGGDQVRSMALDAEGHLWVGLGGNGLDFVDRQMNQVTHYRNDPQDPNSLDHDLVEAVYVDRGGSVWVGTYTGVNRFDPETNGFVRYLPDPQNLSSPDRIGVDFVVEILEDREGLLWFASYGKGLDAFDSRTGTYRHYVSKPDDPTTLSNDTVTTLLENEDGDLWVGTTQGLNLWNRENETFRQWRHQSDEDGSLSHNSVVSLCIAANGALWVGTHSGLNRYHPETDQFTSYSERFGFLNDNCVAMLEDDQGRIWISTNKGLIRFEPETEKFRTFTYDDGLQGNEFHMGAATRSPDGTMFFGGLNGITVFDPNLIKPDSIPPKVVLTELSLLNKPVALSTPARPTPLTVPIDRMSSLTLDHTHNDFTLTFSALHYANPQKNRFRYKLEGFDTHWVNVNASRRIATYTNLDSGEYVFRVEAINLDGVASARGRHLGIRITPPPWRTTWAYTLYFLGGSFLLIWIVTAQRRKLAFERSVNERLKQVDRLKDEFLANTSHELRTPLNGIIGLAESLRDGVAGPVADQVDANLAMIVSGGRRLASLVNDILDFSKLRNHNLELNRTAVDLRPLCDVVVTLSRPLIRSNKLVLENQVERDMIVYADENRVLQILHNLVGNAIKFTDAGSVRLRAERRDGFIQVEVSDTGIGIAQEQQERIFESFAQADGSDERSFGGTGLGLSVSKELVGLHGGTIGVHSTRGEGATFFFTLPICDAAPESIQIGQAATQVPRPIPDLAANAIVRPTREGSDARILVVDDEPVNRQVLINHLSMRGFHSVEASDGHEALRLIREETPFDLVLLDVMMPHLSGYQVCEEIRKQFGPHQLPIIFLTAKNRVSDLVSGFAIGGNDYLTKPIMKEELLARVDTHLDLARFNHDLEKKVNARTAELRLRNEELETLDQIVRTVNQQVHLGELAQTLLDQAIALVYSARKGFCLVYDDTEQVFRCEAASGYTAGGLYLEEHAFQQLLNEDQLMPQQTTSGVYTIRGDLQPRNGISLPLAASRLLIAMPFGRTMGAFLVLDHPETPDAFRDTDIHMLSRFREHAVTAMTKTKMIRDLVKTRKDLVDSAHVAGMAEIAVNVVHMVGNSLNSLTTTTQLLETELKNNRNLTFFDKLMGKMNPDDEHWATFVENSEQGQKVREIFSRIGAGLHEHQQKLAREVDDLSAHVRNIQSVLQDQERYAGLAEHYGERVRLREVIRAAVDNASYLFEETDIHIVREIEDVPPVWLNPVKMQRILLCLLKNAWEAMLQSHHKQITIRCKDHGDEIHLSVSDTGSGIALAEHPKIFAQGFTTKQDAKGFGLHYCANAVSEMGGTIEANSSGPGAGTTVTILLPRREGPLPQEPDAAGEAEQATNTGEIQRGVG